MAQIFPHLLIYRAWCFVNLAADFLICNHASFFSFAKSLSSFPGFHLPFNQHFLCFSRHACLLAQVLWSASFRLVLSLYLSHFTQLYFSSFSPVPLLIFFFLHSHSTQTFHPASPYLLFLLSGPPIVPVRPCCPIITSPSLSGCCPQCNCDRQAGSLSVIAHWSNTCQSEDPTWGSHCVFVCLKYMYTCEHLCRLQRRK